MTDEPSGLLKALHAVQAKAPAFKRDATGQIQSRTYKYVTLDAIMDEVRPLLEANDLVWSCLPGGTHDEPALYYELAHVPSGETRSGLMPLMVGEHPTSQALGSAITYARRYALTAVLNLVADEDDDGAASQGYGRAPQKAREGSGATSGRPMASEAQIKLISRLLKEKKVTDEQRELVMNTLGIPPELHANQLTGGKDGQASALISFLKENPIPTGESDVPSDTSEFEQPELEGGDPVPFDEETKP